LDTEVGGMTKTPSMKPRASRDGKDRPAPPTVAKARELLLPWAALAGAALGWFLSQQTGSDLVFIHCGAASPLAILLIGLVALALVLAGAWLSWRIGRRGDDEPRRFVAWIGLLTAALLGLAIIVQTAAAFIIPRCFS
jgi:hypothetical protein